MKIKAKTIAASLVALTALVAASCNTVEGVGRDVESAGKSIERAGQ